MRILRNTRGQMRVIETILAVSIIFAAVSFAGIFAVRPASPGYEVTDLEKMGYSALHDLDQQGLLTPLVYGAKWSDLRTILKITLPVEVYFDLKVYDLNWQQQNNQQMIYGDSATFANAKNVASVTYSLVGSGATYNPRILVLQITRG